MARAKRKFVECAFAIVVDERESAPYSFVAMRDDRTRLPIMVPLHTKTLKTGDYTILGHEHRLTIERKSKSDLFSTISPKTENGARRERFIAQLQRMNEMEFAAVAVEATVPQIWFDPPENSELSPKSVIRSIFSWMVKFPRVQWVMSESRIWSEMTVYRLLEKFHEYRIKSVDGVDHGLVGGHQGNAGQAEHSIRVFPHGPGDYGPGAEQEGLD